MYACNVCMQVLVRMYVRYVCMRVRIYVCYVMYVCGIMYKCYVMCLNMLCYVCLYAGYVWMLCLHVMYVCMFVQVCIFVCMYV